MVAVPNVEELTQDAAITTITGAELKVGIVTQQTSNTVGTGKVITQDPTSGSLVPKGSPVKLAISSGPQMVAVPSVEGSTQAAATTAITEARLKVGTVTQQTSNTVATGNVISQDPTRGTFLAEGSPVNLVICSGQQMVTVPNLEGLTQAAATALIARAKRAVGSVTATGKVMSQDPASGSSVPQGSSVNLVISLGAQMTTVPNVERMTQAAATAAVTAANLTVGTITQQTSKTVASGNVVSQDQPGGSSVAQGFPMNLVISSGPQMATVPNVEGMTQAAATTVLTASNLTVGTVIQQISNTVAAGQVISQDPPSGGSAVEGSPVNLVISSE